MANKKIVKPVTDANISSSKDVVSKKTKEIVDSKKTKENVDSKKAKEIVVENTEVLTETIKKIRLIPTRETVSDSFSEIILLIETHIETLRENQTKSNGIKFLITIKFCLLNPVSSSNSLNAQSKSFSF